MTYEIALVLTLIGVASLLLITEKLRVDLVAILIMPAAAWLRLVTPAQAFSGLAVLMYAVGIIYLCYA